MKPPRQPKPATPERAAIEAFQVERLSAGDYVGAIRGQSAHSIEMTAKMLRTIFEKQPKILRTVNPEAMPSIRMAAGLCFLWGTGKPLRRWLPKDVVTGSHLSGDGCVRMLLFSSYNAGHRTISPIERMEGWHVGFRLRCAPNACAECLKRDDTWYHESDVPELPHPDCMSPDGCRCTVMKESLRKGTQPKTRAQKAADTQDYMRLSGML